MKVRPKKKAGIAETSSAASRDEIPAIGDEKFNQVCDAIKRG